MTDAVRLVRDPSRLANHEVATYALWRAGGVTRAIDTEDVALLCWQMAPTRFSWKSYPQFPDKEIIRFALADAKKIKYGGLVQGSGAEGWLLTMNGVKWVELNLEVIRQLDSAATHSRVHRGDDQQLRQAQQHHLFQQWRSGNTEPPRYYDVADLARLPADAPRATVDESLSRLEKLAEIAGDQGLKDFIAWVRTGASHG
jgi:hypothetical protein